MQISVILAHPYDESFNHAIAKTVVDTLKENNHTVYFHDLYKENFDPVMTAKELVSDHSEDKQVIEHYEEIKSVDGIIIIHPNWWGQPPAILKGWIDRVFRQGIVYDFAKNDKGEGYLVKLVKAQTGLVFNTANTPEQVENTVFGDPLENLWKACVFGFCGIQTFDRKLFRVVVSSTEQERKEWLNDAAKLTNKYFPKNK